MQRRRAACGRALLASLLTPACPQLLDDDFGLAPDAAAGGGAGGAGAGGAGAGGAGGASAPDTTPPTVLETTPTNGARGVAPDAHLEITFSEPMDVSATEAAYASTDLPDVSFSWRDDNRVLVIDPSALLDVATGTDAGSVTAHEYTFELTSRASDRAGNPLAPLDVTFAVAREITQTVSAEVNPTQSGNWRSDGVYGVETCDFTSATVCIGDSISAGAPSYRGFVTFDLSPLPADRLALSAAELSLTVSSIFSNPFAALGALQLESVRFDDVGIGPAAFDRPARAALGTLATGATIGDDLTADVLSAVEADATLDGPSQYRLRFERDAADDGMLNMVIFELGTIQLQVSYLVP